MKTNPLITLLAALSLALAAVGSAQAVTPALQHVSHVTTPGYLDLSYDHGLHLEFSQANAADLSPVVKAIELESGPLETGFEAIHAYTSLSETVSYYWHTLTDLGFKGALEASSRDEVRYTFTRGNRHLNVVFSQRADSVVAALSWTPMTMASVAN